MNADQGRAEQVATCKHGFPGENWDCCRAERDIRAEGGRMKPSDPAWGIYAYLCGDCGHLLSRHWLAKDGDLREGPYCCGHCDCEQPQDGPFVPLDRRQYEEWAAEHPDLTWDAANA